MGEDEEMADFDAAQERVIDWEQGLPTLEDLMPLSQTLIPPELASAFSITLDPCRTILDVNRASQNTITRLRRRVDPLSENLKSGRGKEMGRGEMELGRGGELGRGREMGRRREPVGGNWEGERGGGTEKGKGDGKGEGDRKWGRGREPVGELGRGRGGSPWGELGRGRGRKTGRGKETGSGEGSPSGELGRGGGTETGRGKETGSGEGRRGEGARRADRAAAGPAYPALARPGPAVGPGIFSARTRPIPGRARPTRRRPGPTPSLIRTMSPPHWETRTYYK
ncbi:tapetal oleosin GRP-16-like [Nymphaea colorata]|uniref:tapetal oleosin GRP-16-like n=1 Tax=Nymphaea colorata TaxID=210225 RepID=UPI00129DD9AB|nr:tapetal oleosin GRP-16-like [Nymphaea colorata]